MKRIHNFLVRRRFLWTKCRTGCNIDFKPIYTYHHLMFDYWIVTVEDYWGSENNFKNRFSDLHPIGIK